MPVSTAVSVTFAAGTTASDASRTVPTTLAVSNWAEAVPAAITHTHTARTRARIARTSRKLPDFEERRLSKPHNDETNRRQTACDGGPADLTTAACRPPCA